MDEADADADADADAEPEISNDEFLRREDVSVDFFAAVAEVFL